MLIQTKALHITDAIIIKNNPPRVCRDLGLSLQDNILDCHTIKIAREHSSCRPTATDEDICGLQCVVRRHIGRVRSRIREELVENFILVPAPLCIAWILSATGASRNFFIRIWDNPRAAVGNCGTIIKHGTLYALRGSYHKGSSQQIGPA